jgi:hypothetical protein
MITAELNSRLTRVGKGTPMGELLRRYGMPIAGVSEFDALSPLATKRYMCYKSVREPKDHSARAPKRLPCDIARG